MMLLFALNKIVLILLFGCIAKINCQLTEVIQTTKGPVQGEILKTIIDSKEYSSFKGIPYAEPPVGFLRFKPPVEKKAWHDVLKTTVEGANCVQKDFVYKKLFTGSEDCLSLNVYTPQTKFDKTENDLKPVMIWIYGGTFKSGYGNSSLYGADFIIEEDVVLVTFNYRLGPLGFLSLSHENATGNAGLKDQNLVLRWVQQNIAKFGGDPNNVTLVGQSAGGVAVDLHVLSDMSKGLFHRTISMSASPLCPWAFHTPTDAEAQAFELGYRLGLSKQSKNKDDLLKLLYEASPVLLMQITEQLGGVVPPFRPTIESVHVAENEEKFLTECLYNKYEKGEFTKVPHLTGFAKDETLRYTTKINTFLEVLHSTTNYLKSLPSILPFKMPHLNTIFSEIANGIENIVSLPIMSLVRETTDILFIHGINAKQKYLHKNNDNHPVYYYRLSYETEQSIHKLMHNISLSGVAHGDDVGYLFRMTVVDLPIDLKNPTFIMTKRIVRMWTNFAKYSNPIPHDVPDPLLEGITWPESGSSGTLLDINDKLAVGNRPTGHWIQLYQPIESIVLALQTGCTPNALSAIIDLIKE